MDTIITLVRRRLAVIALCAVIGATAALATALTGPQSFRATARLFVATSAQDVATASQGDQAAKSRVRTYAALATSEDVLRQAAGRVTSTTSAADVKSAIVVSSPPDTVLLDIAATADDAGLAAAKAQAVADQMVATAALVEKPIRSGPPSIGLVILQPAASGVTTVPRFDPVTIGMYTAGGLLVGLLIALLTPERIRLSGRFRK
ncbi:Lipopolysaccharide biosynthesis protein OS=Tsukamurella paurometabola (strain ATCC 8368 / DSM/ CCUG 35730 / CIP 100753 / JCM 10117 / KCTC 9821 / NBRC 16120/ NCIMB 702349 / NCTC 13040) OX=521096 GN=Tpau_2603 PE=4 SV=1 [Tsukamurella paurometabola]|uniref:Lipopolysaccharide biosynthesis protein n=1 Tax=Tsukamurella paurometabola (strain ATCC 8368 / DSM 20162 / CCUG 35730 / CIP 100753 / JCM 10117 / KCTC 9821 / NBRC 16120 / NCIMB 702349 / NCTC 13040) TaxID=521096 RepID=D5US01_TSUPD|nr:Wzz/FepE/Etk N-terminal domain-containing protein [Tsukamurella paurometabola]ADG79206.1 lipopolysaccharide biosynthesis protein [Tsukamurella paurometabola DSM 20162]SUP34543.1 Capsular polysaccharide biosynthesis protein [Tsukamurella paurometabola]